MPISEIHLQTALEDLDMTMDQFIELCILLGCDYLEPIKGIGPKTALKLLREHGSLAKVVEFIRGKMAEKAEENKAAFAAMREEESESDRESEDGAGASSSPAKPKSPKKKKKITSSGMQIPEFWPWEEAKQLFIKPDVVKGEDLEVGRLVEGCGM